MSRLYLVDDQTMVREGLRCLLEAAGHEVLGEAADATVALSDILRLRPDIVLLELQLGGVSGLQLLDELRRRGQGDVRAIVVTLSRTARDVAQAVRAGVRGYLLKTDPAAELMGAVADVAAGRRRFAAGMAELALDALGDSPGSAQQQLSARELQIVTLVAGGASSAEVGLQLHLSPKTVDTYRSRAMAKIGATDLPALVRWSIREGLIALDG